ncbi:MAG: Bis(5'-nucleosyl)-tetraphosphatase (symmetrical) [Magnetococcales bacterium]|nr:Bis(5'-nucleosyl)-tetraphosphatase (symmetrical) [Magnetococcales bacterium]HIJ82635.1 symmetrical bis(5'-nucleosyl)-tetraphosphatase [Magnetococcales bacterium]
MAVYAIGDVHGCLSDLHRLLDLLVFDPARDRLLFVGDLINRGPSSVECLRFVRSLGPQAQVVMGNHEVNILRQIAMAGTSYAEPWQRELDRTGDRDALVDWISRLPLLLHDQETGFFVVHAGLHPLWSMEEAMEKAARVGRLAAGLERVMTFYAPLDRPVHTETFQAERRAAWEDQTIFTRIRLTAANGRPVWPEEAREIGMSDPYACPPAEFSLQPWYRVRRWPADEKVVYGHWAALGVNLHDHSKGLDGGCVYGGRLTAIRLDHPELPVTQVPCPNHASVGQGGEG